MVSFLVCFGILVVGYLVYGSVVAKTLGPDDRETPAVYKNDGVDYVVLPQWKLFMIQLLNIAGLGPIFGALTGALWGPVVFLWITFGTVFAGGVHDYFSGMMSEREDGKSISEVCGIYLGPVMKNIMRVFSVVLLVMVGTVFAAGPAGLLKVLFTNNGLGGLWTNYQFLLTVILIYYFIATFVPIDAIIGRVYPLFGICLIIMAVGVICGIAAKGFAIPELMDNFRNLHPAGTPIWSAMFITVACGAISGFHSTQSPLMARCMKSEKQGHFVFYGAMVAEGMIALVWAAAGCALYAKGETGLSTGLAELIAKGQPVAIYDVCQKTMGGIGIALAMLGVIVCPITSGDTAFRSARLTLADWFGLDQKSYAMRAVLTIPLLGVGAYLAFDGNYGALWQHFSWTNQALAMIVLWTASMFLYKNKKNYWITVVPATFMSAVTGTFFVSGKIYLNQPVTIAYPAGIIIAVLFLALFIRATKKAAVK